MVIAAASSHQHRGGCAHNSRASDVRDVALSYRLLSCAPGMPASILASSLILLHHPLTHLSYPPNPCHSQVRPETPALDAMVLMEEKGISAVAVVNAEGAIIGNFSISELR